MKKRVISLILTLIFVLTLVPAAALTGSAASAYYNVVMFPIVKQVQSATGAEPGEQVFEFEITGTMDLTLSKIPSRQTAPEGSKAISPLAFIPKAISGT